MRNGFLVSLATLLAGAGLAHAQGYYPGYPYPTYNHPGYYPPLNYQQAAWQPTYSMPMGYYPNRPGLQGMPQGYYYPVYYPAPTPRPVVHGWPPGPILTPPRGSVKPASATPLTTAASPAKAPAAPSPAAVLPASALPVSALPATNTDKSTPAHAAKWHWKKPQTHCDNCQATPPGAPLIDPAPGTPLVCTDGSCATGTCTDCTPCATACPSVCQPPLEHKYPCHAPKGYCVYGNAEFLYWFFKNQPSPVLLNVGNREGGTDAITASDIDNEERIGVRGTFGFWINHQHTLGFEVAGFYLIEHSPEQGFGGAPISRPFFNVNTNLPDSRVINGTGVATGTALLDSDFRLWNGEANLRYELYRFVGGHIDILGGFRYLELQEGLRIQTNSTPTGGVATLTTDRFTADNRFLGGQVGINLELNSGPFFVNAYTKFAAGNIRQRVTISGEQTTAGVTTPAGFLAQPSNIGDYTRDDFALIPEAGLSVGVALNDCLRIYAGYSILYLINAVRPGDQIDTRLNLTQAPPGPLQPFFNFNDSTFWAQGAHVGVQIRY